MKRLLRAVLLTYILIMSFSLPCNAQDEIPAAKVNIPIFHELEGDAYSGTHEVTYILKAENAANPMPEGADNGEKTITTSSSTPDFGDITLQHPEAYYYTLERKYEDTKEWTHDKSTYRILIVKFNTDKTAIAAWKDGETKVDRIEFADVYKKEIPPEEKRGLPITGDAAKLYLMLTVFIAALLGCAVFIRAKHVNKEEGKQ